MYGTVRYVRGWSMRSVLVKSVLVTIVAMFGSLAIASVVMTLQGQELDPNALLLSFLCPLLIAWPASAWGYWQRERMRQVHEDLSAAHDALADAHRMLAQAHARLADRASRDAMTGMLNRETFLKEIEALHESGQAGSLLIIDADHFKSINDTHGHAVGDAALVEIAAAIGRSAGRGVVAGRIGGEEFAACIPTGNPWPQAAVAEAIRSSVASTRLTGADGRPISLTVSIGGATFTPNRTLGQVLREADGRLYAAKNGGRNMVVTCPSESARAAA
jgi:diguanylate cyclase (GGDEF)-like protein